jgi:very-short-patch-repair endonuclease
MAIRNILLDYAKSKVLASPGELPRAEHLNKLMNLAGSSLEKGWLQFLEDRDLRLPSKAQHFLDACKTRPDFFYEDQLALIYVDGPVHEFTDRAERDLAQTECLEDLGYTVIRFRHQDDWGRIISRFPHVFGVKKGD